MRKLKDSGIEWLSEIPENWEVKRLKKILAERNEKNNPLKSTNLLSLSIERGVFPYSEKTGGGNKAKEKFEDYKIAYENDIVLNSMNVIVGAVGLSKFYGCVSPVYYTLYSRNNSYNINYYNNIFQSDAFQKSLWGLGNGIVVKESDNGKLNTIRMRIPMEKLNNVLMPIPPIMEQEKIAKFLDKKVIEIDNIIEKTKETIEDYKRYKQSVITEAVTKGLNKDEKLIESNIQWIGKCPEKWKKVQLKNYVKLNNGKEIIEEVKKENENAVDVFGSGGVFKYTNNSLYTGKAVLFGRKGTLGKPLYIDQAFWTVDTMYYLTFDDYLIEPKFCYYQLLGFDWNPYITQTALPSIVGTQIISCYFIFPDIEQQKAIVNYLDKKCNEIDNLITSKQKVIQELAQYKKSLIYEYVTGKKEVI